MKQTVKIAEHWWI